MQALPAGGQLHPGPVLLRALGGHDGHRKPAPRVLHHHLRWCAQLRFRSLCQTSPPCPAQALVLRTREIMHRLRLAGSYSGHVYLFFAALGCSGEACKHPSLLAVQSDQQATLMRIPEALMLPPEASLPVQAPPTWQGSTSQHLPARPWCGSSCTPTTPPTTRRS